MEKISWRKITDVLLLAIFFAELVGLFLPSWLHELLGVLFFGLVAWHNKKNIVFYQTLGQGRYSPKRSINGGNIFLLGIGSLSLLISGLALTNWVPAVFASSINWRSLHLGAASAVLLLLFVHSLLNARRYIRGKVFYRAATLLFLTAASGMFALPYLDRWYHQVIVNKEEITVGEKVVFPLKTAIVYFSRVGNTNFPAEVDAVSGASIMRDGDELIGNTQMISYMVQDAIGDDMFAIRTVKKYPADYAATTEDAKREFDTDAFPPLQPEPVNIETYEAIILVYPLWWGTLPMAVKSFLHDHDLKGKIIVPIVTHGGGGAGNSIDTIKRSTQGIVENAYLDIYSSDIPASRQRISDYLRDIKFSLETKGR